MTQNQTPNRKKSKGPNNANTGVQTDNTVNMPAVNTASPKTTNPWNPNVSPNASTVVVTEGHVSMTVAS